MPPKPEICPICGSTEIRPDDHEIDPGWRCVPKGHVVIDHGEYLSGTDSFLPESNQ